MTKPKAKRDNELAKGQSTLKGFGFCQPVLIEKKTGKENEMALSSNLLKGSVQRCKQAAASNNSKRRNTQKKLDGTKAKEETCCDDGTKVCPACAWNEKNKPKKAKFSHDPTCTIISNYKITNGGRISMAQYYFEKYE